MSWLKNVVLDIAVTVIVFIYVFTEATWAWWVIVVYTPFMLLLKVVAALNATRVKPITGQKKKAVQAPDAFFHVLYAATIVILVYHQWWLMAAAWAGIWLASFMYLQRSKPSETSA